MTTEPEPKFQLLGWNGKKADLKRYRRFEEVVTDLFFPLTFRAIDLDGKPVADVYPDPMSILRSEICLQ